MDLPVVIQTRSKSTRLLSPTAYGSKSLHGTAIHELLASERFGNICEKDVFAEYIHEVKPDCIFHLAAQPIIRRSYRMPVETFETNVMGSIYLMDALRTLAHPCTVIMITSDKCYLNTNQVWGYRECDPLGGHDPYSASKAAAEIAIASYRDSYFPPEKIREHKIHLASVPCRECHWRGRLG